MSTNISPLISEARQEAVEKALLQTFGKTEVQDLVLLQGGLSGSGVYKIVVDQKSYLLKLSQPQPMLSAPSHSVYRMASEAQIAPRLHFMDEESGVSISAFVEGAPIFTLPPDRIIHELAPTIKAIHQLKADVPAFDLLAFVDASVQWLQQSGLFSKNIWDEFISLYEVIRMKYPWNDPDKVLSHNDLNPGNILWDGNKAWIIDWDVASVTDRYVDLAVFANFLVHHPEQEELFLNIYFDHEVTDLHRARFFMMRQFCRIIFTKQMLERAVQTMPDGFTGQPDATIISLREVGTLLRTGQMTLQHHKGQYLYGMAVFREAIERLRGEVVNSQ